MKDNEQWVEAFKKREGLGMDKKDCVNYRNGDCIISADYAPRCGKCDAYQTEEDVQANGYIGLLGSVLLKHKGGE